MRTLRDMAHIPGIRTSMDIEPIRSILGEDTPDITPDALGKYRLLNALKNKFGPNYRNNPSAAGAISHFEKEHNLFSKMREYLSQSRK